VNIKSTWSQYPSAKSFPNFNEIRCVGRGRWVIHDSMPYDPIQGLGHGGLKVAKWPISKSISSAGMHVIKRLTVNYDTPRWYLNFSWTHFWYLSSFGVRWPSKLGCSICLLRGKIWLAVSVWLIYMIIAVTVEDHFCCATLCIAQ